MYDGTFAAPSPGVWELESTHMARPMSRWMAPVYMPALMRGFSESMARYGLLLEMVEIAHIDGFVYGCPRGVGAPKSAKGPPPKLVFKLLTWLHPEIRRRIKRCRQVFEQKLWRTDVERWDREVKPALARSHSALQAVRPDALDAPALLAHVEACQAAVAHSVYMHHAFNACCMVPTGDFLVQAAGWTGQSSAQLLGLLTGSSPISMGATTELDQLVEALRADPLFLRQLESRSAPEGLAALRAAPEPIGQAARAYLDLVGMRILSGYDVADPVAEEVPVLLMRAIRSAVTGTSQKAGDQAIVERTVRLRDLVPAHHRATFDDLLAEARFVNRIRDERCYLNDAWSVGLARRALLECGRRLQRAGLVQAFEQVVDLRPEELSALLSGRAGPSAEETAAYARYRQTKTLADAPATIGGTPSGPPPAEWLPPYAARATRAVGAVLSAMFDVARVERKEPTLLRGLAASPGLVEGTARLVLDAESFGRVERGDVLIARVTCPSYNVLLPIIAGIVTDRGGVLSHAAIVAREYGMPAVVGTAHATTMIPDGARVRVDGSKGEVQLL